MSSPAVVPPAVTAHRHGGEKPTHWNRFDFDSWQEQLPAARRDEDQKSLAGIFNRAADVPALREALDWARAHDIRFFIDHTTRAGGYYTVGTGVVAIARTSLADPAFAAAAAVHEIRHAWQDYYGMIPTSGETLAGYFTRLSAIEADATAHEKLAEKQYRAWARAEAARKNLDAVPQLVVDEKRRPALLKAYRSWDEKARKELEAVRRPAAAAELWESFKGWYRSRAGLYGSNARRHLGKRLGIPGVQAPDFQGEYQPYENLPFPLAQGLDVADEQQLRRLGKGFRGGNYFDAADRGHPLERDRLHRDFLSAARADAAYGGRPDPLAREIRRRQLLLKAHRRGKPSLI
jgi:hypothetical protein